MSTLMQAALLTLPAFAAGIWVGYRANGGFALGWDAGVKVSSEVARVYSPTLAAQILALKVTR